jgi:2-oxoacid:acceptor oxidoreductase gamma subunit (pyruvate/2-ketoisovalerate family)
VIDEVVVQNGRGHKEQIVIELKIRGRGGQGAVIASEMLGKACFLEGKYPQSFSVFGGERRGAPVFGYLRVDSQPILLKCQIQRPDHEIIFDLTLADELEIAREIKPGGTALVNTGFDVGEFPKLREFNLGLVNATAIAKSAGLETNFNTAVLGAYVRLTNLVKMESLEEALKGMLPVKAEENIEAMRQGYEKVRVHLP